VGRIVVGFRKEVTFNDSKVRQSRYWYKQRDRSWLQVFRQHGWC